MDTDVPEDELLHGDGDFGGLISMSVSLLLQEDGLVAAWT